MADNKIVQAMRDRSRSSLEKSARNAGVKDVGHKNKLQLARDIDRARKDERNRKARDTTAGRKFARRPEEKRSAPYAGYHDKKGKWHPKSNSAAYWNAYRKEKYL